MSKYSSAHFYDSYHLSQHSSKLNTLQISIDFKDTITQLQNDLSDISRAFESIQLSDCKITVRQTPRRQITCPSPPRANNHLHYCWSSIKY